MMSKTDVVKTKAAHMVSTMLEAGKKVMGTAPEVPPVPPLAEASDAAVIAILKKYHILNPDGTPRLTTINDEPKPGPILDQSVIDMFVELDPTKNKRLFEWMLYAAGGGEAAQRQSQRVLDLSKEWVIGNRMKGFGKNHDEDKGEHDVIKPMTQEEAEADWKANSEAEYTRDCFFADEDFAKDPAYPVFGYFRHWPGRKVTGSEGVYAQVVEAVTAFLAICADKKRLSEYNRLNPAAPFQLSVWNDDGSPRYKDVESLATVCREFKASFARRRAEKNVQFIGREHDDQGVAKPGFTRGANVKLFTDANLDVYIPATAAASMKTGAPNWCTANKSRWDEYFRTRQKTSLNWGQYTDQRGPFIYWQVKAQVHDPHLKRIAGHITGKATQIPGGIEFWDVQNSAHISWDILRRRLNAESPDLLHSFETSLTLVQEWFKTYKKGQDIESYPALESKKRAEQLVKDMLG